VPQRPALAVKVDNYAQARPQSGLDMADIVFEEPVEGGITRYVAVFQCQGAPEVGPIRSARNIDIGILGQFGRPLLDPGELTDIELEQTVDHDPVYFPGTVDPGDPLGHALPRARGVPGEPGETP